MGYYCSICKAETSALSIKTFLCHFRLRHGISKCSKLAIVCAQNSCKCTLDSIASLDKHLRRYHPTGSTRNESFVENVARDDQTNMIVDVQPSDDVECSDNSNDTITLIKNEMAKLLLVVQKKHGCSNVVVDGFKDIFELISNHFGHKLNSVINQANGLQLPSDELKQLLVEINALPSVVNEVSSSYLRHKFL